MYRKLLLGTLGLGVGLLIAERMLHKESPAERSGGIHPAQRTLTVRPPDVREDELLDARLLTVEDREVGILSEGACKKQKPPVIRGSFGAPDFALIVAQGSTLRGFNTLRVTSAGKCDFHYFVTTKQIITAGNKRWGLPEGTIYIDSIWRRAEFQLTNRMQRQLWEALRRANLFGLKDDYIDEEIADGTQWIVRLRMNGREKRIYCSNAFPESLRKLSGTLRKSIMVPHRMELVTATRIKKGSFRPNEEGWLEDP
jgi:hypothetical protein